MNKSTTTSLTEHKLIPFPCHQNWADLDLREADRKHCSECDCEVRDLTDMKPDEIYALQEELGGKLCGKIYKKNNYIVNTVESHSPETVEEGREKSILTLPKIISGSIAALSLASCATSDTNSKAITSPEAQAFPKDNEPEPMQKSDYPIEQCVLGMIAPPPKVTSKPFKK